MKIFQNIINSLKFAYTKIMLFLAFLFPNFFFSRKADIYDNNTYKMWRINRINKLKSIYDLNSKKILELGAAKGTTSYNLSQVVLNSHFTIAEGREELLNEAKKRYKKEKNFLFIRIDNDSEWNKNLKKFDLIIHWGLLYHLSNWKKDLLQCIKIADHICLETVTYDSKNINSEFFLREREV